MSDKAAFAARELICIYMPPQIECLWETLDYGINKFNCITVSMYIVNAVDMAILKPDGTCCFGKGRGSTEMRLSCSPITTHWDS